MFIIPPPTTDKRRKSERVKRNLIEEWKHFASVHGYELVSEQYVGTQIPMEWKNPDGYIFKKNLNNLKNQGWVHRLPPEQELDILRDIALQRGGRLISNDFKGSKIKLNFVDSANNIFSMTPNNVKNGHWSPYEGNITEHLCRQILEGVFGYSFPLKHGVLKQNVKYQLDGYSSEMNMAFEYQGHDTHYKCPKTIKRDELKREYCKHNNITLFVIDKITTMPVHEAVFIAVEKMLGKETPPKKCFEDVKLDYSTINHSKRYLEFWKCFGIENGFELLSEVYQNAKTPLKWRKKDGTIFERSPRTIKGSGWPTFTRLSKSRMRSKSDWQTFLEEYGLESGFKLLSKYEKYDIPLKWQKNDGTIFERSWATIRKDGWPKFTKHSLSKMSVVLPHQK